MHTTAQVPFAHEPSITRSDQGQYVMYYTHYDYGEKYPPCSECVDGSTPPSCAQPNPPSFIVSMIHADSLNGTWSQPIKILDGKSGVLSPFDNNFDAIILSNGSVLGMARDWDENGCSVQHLVTASEWKRNDTYVMSKAYLFPELDGMCTEDAFLWRDCAGYYHALFHNMDPARYIGLDGAHAFSEDGIQWVYGGYSFGDVVEFTDGTQVTLGSRERPHVMFDHQAGCTPLALTSGVVYGGGSHGDQSYTLLQPIEH